ncbi:hypothetical protein ACIBQX_18815 [Nonomuraea sp. NPDC049714]|uniref:hypothetical protein n=1 Tax=Nonomuraea sp. NPDC049714 TaxID=3364357 RepID=UPI0037B664B3
MAVAQIPAISVEYVKVAITGPTGVDLTELDVALAIVADGQIPVTDDWKVGTWIGTSAAVLIGPGTLLPLDQGTYYVYVKITSTPEVPVLPSGSIHIT